jgi:hypothetical protein
MKSSTLETGHKLDKQDIARFISRNRGDFNDLFRTGTSACAGRFISSHRRTGKNAQQSNYKHTE